MKRESVVKNVLLIFIVSACFQNIYIISFNGFALKPYHLIGISLLLFTNLRKIILPNKKILIFSVLGAASTLLGAAKFGLNSLLFNYIFGFIILIIFLNLNPKFSLNCYKDIMMKASWIILAIIFINWLMNINAIIRFFQSPYGHPIYNFIFSGGANLEASWVSILGVFSGDGKKKYLYTIITLIISSTLASRAGVIINLLIIMYYLKKENKAYIRIISLLLAGIIIICLFDSQIFNFLISRFMKMGSDLGSKGRLNMWELFWPTFFENIFGVGIGNSIKAIEYQSHVLFFEDNIHNLIMQNFLDLGLIGGIYYIYMVIKFFIKELKNKFNNPFSIFLMIYFIIGLIQFRGGDTIFFVVLSIYFSTSFFNSNKIIDNGRKE